MRANYFIEDHTHTSKAGARLNAAIVAGGLRAINDLSLTEYLKDDAGK